MSSMIKYIKESFNDILNELDWMDTDTMTVAEEKVYDFTRQWTY